MNVIFVILVLVTLEAGNIFIFSINPTTMTPSGSPSATPISPVASPITPSSSSTPREPTGYVYLTITGVVLFVCFLMYFGIYDFGSFRLYRTKDTNLTKTKSSFIPLFLLSSRVH